MEAQDEGAGERIPILEFFDKVEEPKTVGEVSEAFSGRLERATVETTLQKLRNSGDLECKALYPECTVYWRTKPACATGDEVLRTPRTNKGSAIKRPPLHSFKTPARLGSASPRVQSSRKARTAARARCTGAVLESDENSEDLARTVEQLKEELEEVNSEIAALSRDYREEELQLHIEALHEYNEVKDAGQILLGKLAEVERTTTASLYEKFGLSLDD